jgi:hypothetical protein
VRFSSPSEPNRHSINCYPKENARQKPRNLKKLEDDRQMSLKKGGRAQFTVNMIVQFFVVQLQHMTYLYLDDKRRRDYIYNSLSICE